LQSEQFGFSQAAPDTAQVFGRGHTVNQKGNPPVTQNGGASSKSHSGEPLLPPKLLSPAFFAPLQKPCWFAVRTKPRHEKKAQLELEQKGVRVFLPLIPSVRQWTDRKQIVQLPLFGNYLFVSVSPDRNERATVLKTRGVLGFVGYGGLGSTIPDEQIEAVQSILREKLNVSPHPFLRVGQTIRVRGGSLDGMQGILLNINGNQSLVISIECVEKSVAVQIEGYRVEAV
jgi:transcription elongation factor/antiterminator RfaH